MANWCRACGTATRSDRPSAHEFGITDAPVKSRFQAETLQARFITGQVLQRCIVCYSSGRHETSSIYIYIYIYAPRPFYIIRDWILLALMFIECFLIFNDVKFPPVLSLKTRVRSFKARFSFRGDAYSLHLRRPLYRRCVTRTLDIIVSSRSL